MSGAARPLAVPHGTEDGVRRLRLLTEFTGLAKILGDEMSLRFIRIRQIAMSALLVLVFACGCVTPEQVEQRRAAENRA